MSFLNLFRKADMTAGLEACRADPGAVLIDVRSPGEFARGRIPGSCNLPMEELREILTRFPDRGTPIYLYCLSGARSSFAKEELERMGYGRVIDLGGIHGYHGKVER